MRGKVVAVAAALILLAAAAAAQESAGARHAVILMYHHVDTGTPGSTSVKPAEFRAHVEYLDDEGFEVWPLEAIFDHLGNGEPLPRQTIALTFDDGYSSVLANAAPLLAARDWPFTVFVSTEAIDRGYAGYLSWDQLRSLTNRGATVANHTRSHAHLVRRQPGENERAWERRVRAEITDAQDRIEQEIGQAPPLFAYPYGEFDAEMERIVTALGYYGVGQHSGAVSNTSLGAAPRFPMASGFADMDAFALRVRVRPLPVIEPRSPAAIVRATKDTRPVLRLELGEGEFRIDELACYASGQGRMGLTVLGDRSFRATPQRPIRPGRTKYNCTAPSTAESGVYHWASFLWMVTNADGSWYEE